MTLQQHLLAVCSTTRHRASRLTAVVSDPKTHTARLFQVPGISLRVGALAVLKEFRFHRATLPR
jgi:hypothetical protein